MTAVTLSFATKVAAKIGADPAYVFQILSQWEPFENANAAFNPLATTQHAAGSRPLGGNPNQNNGNPVQEYPDEDTGAAATAQTLLNGYYPNLVKGLQTGNVDASAAPEVRKWGTTGFANKLDGGKGSDTPTGGDSLRKSQEARVLALQKQLDDGYANEPPDQMDETTGVNEHDGWIRRMQLINTSLSNAYTALGRKDQTFANDIASQDQGIKIDTLNQNRDSKEIDRFLNGLQESRGRAQEIAAAKKQLIEYGAPQGKTSFSYRDLGGGALEDAIARGVNPDSAAVNYSGQTYLDPQGDMSNYDKMFGVQGQIPSMGAPRTQYSSIPQQSSGGDPGQDPGTDPATLGAGLSTDGPWHAPTAAPFSPWQQNGNPGSGFDFTDLSQVQGQGQPPPWTPNYTPYKQRGSMGLGGLFDPRGIGSAAASGLGSIFSRFTSAR